MDHMRVFLSTDYTYQTLSSWRVGRCGDRWMSVFENLQHSHPLSSYLLSQHALYNSDHDECQKNSNVHFGRIYNCSLAFLTPITSLILKI